MANANNRKRSNINLIDFYRKVGDVIWNYSIERHTRRGRWFRKQYSTNIQQKSAGNLLFSAWKMPRKYQNPLTISNCHLWQLPMGSRWNSLNPVTGSVLRNAASMKCPEYSGIGRILRPGLSDIEKLNGNKLNKRLCELKTYVFRLLSFHWQFSFCFYRHAEIQMDLRKVRQKIGIALASGGVNEGVYIRLNNSLICGQSDLINLTSSNISFWVVRIL